MALATVIPMPEVDATLSAYMPYSPPVMELLTYIAVPVDSDVVVTLPACMPKVLPVIESVTFMPAPELDVTLPACIP